MIFFSSRVIPLFCFLWGVVSSEAKIIVLGDSILAPQSTLVSHLAEDLSLDLSTDFQNLATIGSSIETGSVISIPQQYEKFRQVSSNSSDHLLMDGGGNDIFSHRWSCQSYDSNCQQLLETLKIQLRDLFQCFAQDGYFSSVTFLGYYEINGFERVIEEGMIILSQVCRTDSRPACCLVDPRSLNIPKGWDGIHPTDQGYQMLATEIIRQCPLTD